MNGNYFLLLLWLIRNISQEKQIWVQTIIFIENKENFYIIQFPSCYSLTGMILSKSHCYLSPEFPLHIIFKTTNLRIRDFKHSENIQCVLTTQDTSQRHFQDANNGFHMGGKVLDFSGKAKYRMRLWLRSVQTGWKCRIFMPLSTCKVKLILGFVWHNYKVLGEAEPGSVCEQGHEDKELGC